MEVTTTVSVLHVIGTHVCEDVLVRIDLLPRFGRVREVKLLHEAPAKAHIAHKLDTRVI